MGEKPRPRDLELARHGDVVFFSKEFAECIFAESLNRPDCSPEAFLEWVGENDKIRKGGLAVCAWGASGARARRRSETFTSAAFPPLGGVKDPVGAGDSFNGAMIRALSSGRSPKDALSFACKVASFKVGVMGFRPIADNAELKVDLLPAAS